MKTPKRDPEKVREYNRRYYAKRAQDAKYRAHKAAASARWKQEHPGRRRATQQAYRATEKGREIRRRYERENAEVLNAKKRAKYAADPERKQKEALKNAKRQARKAAAEAAARARAIESARRLAEKAGRLAREKREYGIIRKEAV